MAERGSQGGPQPTGGCAVSARVLGVGSKDRALPARLPVMWHARDAHAQIAPTRLSNPPCIFAYGAFVRKLGLCIHIARQGIAVLP